MFTLSYEFINHVVDRYFENPNEPSSQVAGVFNEWYKNDPEYLDKIAEQVGATVEDLCEGDVVAAMKVLSEQEKPLDSVVDVLADPLTQIRMAAAKPVSKETYKAFEDIGLEQFVRELLLIDFFHSTPILTEAVSKTLTFYGFVSVDTYWEGSYAPPLTHRVKFNSFKQVTSPIILPYDDFALVQHYVRGAEQMTLCVYHASQELAKEGTYHARSLVGNSLLLPEFPVLDIDAVRLRYSGPIKDPLALAFDDGFVVKTGKRYAYHPRILIEALAKRADKPEHLYFFYRAVGVQLEALDRPDLKEMIKTTNRDIIRMQFGKSLPHNDDEPVEPVHEVLLDFKSGKIEVDVSQYLPILETENSKRIKNVMNLGNLWHLRIPYAMQSRLDHSIGGMHIARVICNRLGLSEYDRRKVELYALTHDWGHLTGSHPTEVYFKTKMGFDHEEFAAILVQQNADAVEACGVAVEDLVALIKQEDPLHNIVDGPFGADRIYYLSIDANEYGDEKEFDSLKLLTWLKWVDDELIVDQHSSMAFKFLDYRAQQYELLYFAPSTQIADAYQRKMLSRANLQTPFDEIHVKQHETMELVPPEGVILPFWKFTDQLFQFYLANHDDYDVREIMRHLITVYHKSPHVSAAVLKIKGYEDSEPEVKVPLYHEFVYIGLDPVVEDVDANQLARYHQAWLHPDNQKKLEHEISKRSEIPEHHVIVAAVPNLQKLASEHAPVRNGLEVKSLFDWHPEYQKTFVERANRMACLRVAVHPQLYAFAREYFKKHSLAEIVQDVLG